MKKLMFLGLLSFATINSLYAEEYISDEYFSEISAQSEVMHEIMESLPIVQTVEEEAREKEIKEEEQKKLFVPLSSEFTTETLEKKEDPKVVEKEPALSEEKQSIQAEAYSNALAQAKDEKKVIMLAIRSTNCKYCDKIEKETLSDESVKDALKANFITIHYNQDLEELPLNLQNGATPMFIFVNSNEDILNMYPGMRTPTEFKEALAKILTK